MATVFFSWQLDTRRRAGVDLIRGALDDAIAALSADADIEEANREELLLDSDTSGVPGSPPIVDTIFSKIAAAAVFVADLTFVATRKDGKGQVPNPNVLIEYGYALHAVDYSRVIAVMNVAHGEPTVENLPFDLRHLRWPIRFSCPDDADSPTRTAARRGLAKALRDALDSVLAHGQPNEPPPPPFVPLNPLVGQARFRDAGRRIGKPTKDVWTVPFVPEDVYLAPGAATWLRLMPLVALDKPLKSARISEELLKIVDGAQVAPLHQKDVQPMVTVRGDDGVGRFWCIKDGPTPGLVYCFESGEIWNVETVMLSASDKVAPLQEGAFIVALKQAGLVLTALGVTGPYRWIAGMESVSGRYPMFVDGPKRFDIQHIAKDVIQSSGQYSGDVSTAAAALLPFFEAVYDAAGVSRTG